MTRMISVCAALGLALAASAPLHAQNAAARRAARAQSGMPFTVEARHVRAGGQGSNREVTVMLRFRNVTQRPLTLAYDPESRVVTDDRGNRSGTAEPLYGMGAATPPTFDAFFTLAPGSSADVLQRFSYVVPQGKLFGLQFGMQMTVREFQRLPGDQWQPVTSHSLSFDQLREGATIPARATQSASTDACADRTDCSASGDLIAELARVSNSMYYGAPSARLGVRFRNTSSAPVTLCLMQYSAFGTDDRGRPYISGDASTVRAIPLCEQQAGNVSFTIAPGASREASVEYRYRGDRNAIRGTRADLNFAVRQLEVLPGDQVRPVRVIPVLFRDVALLAGERAVAGGGAAAVGTPTNAPTEGLAGQPDPCANVAHCYAAGPFTAQITSAAASRDIHSRFLRIAIRFRNLTSERLVLCFTSGSGVLNDDRQNRYRLAGEAASVKGIGLCGGQTVNTQFVVAPGATRDASLEFTIYHQGLTFGSTHSVTFAVQQLALLPGDQIQETGQYVVNFEEVAASENAAVDPKAVNAKAAGLLELLKKMKKP